VTTARVGTSIVASQVAASASNAAEKRSVIATADSKQAKTFVSELETLWGNNAPGAMAAAMIIGVLICLIGRGANAKAQPYVRDRAGHCVDEMEVWRVSAFASQIPLQHAQYASVKRDSYQNILTRRFRLQVDHVGSFDQPPSLGVRRGP